MDRLRVGVRDPVLVLPGAGDKLSHLKAGDVVRGRVVKVLASGEMSLRIGGALVQARSAGPVPVGAGILFRVLGQEGAQAGAGLRLQVLQMVDGPEAGSPGRSGAREPGAIPLSSPAGDPATETIRSLARELAAQAPLKSGQGEDLAATLRQLLKALPDDPASLPPELRHHLLGLLRSRLRETEQSIQRRAARLLGDSAVQELPELPELSELPESAHPPRARPPLFAEAEKILQIPLKALLQDTGVGLESKLKALARALLAEDGSSPEGEWTPGSQGSPPAGHTLLGNDLKARLLQLRQWLQDHEAAAPDSPADAGAAAGRASGEATDRLERLLPAVEGLLRDIETFQLLSKLTSSFCTFLPLLWKGLREGDIAFKRGRAGGGDPIHYCVLNLDFESLGKVTIVAMMQGGDFFLSFKSDRQGLQSALSGSAHELEEMFLQEGLRLGGISFVAADDPRLTPFERLDAFESVLNLKI
ncbi:MAG: flagellar hook-length control protein FliK [Syntrophobacteraceae bacterium]|jgi:hypothetical protein|nr:flagellar hook-length control protein FliK [Syntrophobacteraceae bacterium]